MKVNIKREVTFKPVTIELTFETEKGQGLFSQLFNYPPVTDICDEFEQLWKELEDIRFKEGSGLYDGVKTALGK